MTRGWSWLFLLLAGCGESHALTVVSGVFSEDGTRAAVMVEHIESTRVCVTYEGCPVDSKDTEYTIVAGSVDADGFVEDETLYVGSGSPPSDFYYMHAAGYLLLEWSGVTGGDHALVVDANGERRLARRAELGAYTEAIPSRDGRFVAEVSRGASSYTVHFVDPANDTTIDSVEIAVHPRDDVTHRFWTHDGRFAVARLPSGASANTDVLWPTHFVRPTELSSVDVVKDCYISATASGPRTEDDRVLVSGIDALPVRMTTASTPASCLAGVTRPE
ncbi:MAG: hypothetical protein RMA76_05730 [Deltaproteobacteria bacterium]|jgi:hypothetical protein